LISGYKTFKQNVKIKFMEVFIMKNYTTEISQGTADNISNYLANNEYNIEFNATLDSLLDELRTKALYFKSVK